MGRLPSGRWHIKRRCSGGCGRLVDSVSYTEPEKRRPPKCRECSRAERVMVTCEFEECSNQWRKLWATHSKRFCSSSCAARWGHARRTEEPAEAIDALEEFMSEVDEVVPAVDEDPATAILDEASQWHVERCLEAAKKRGERVLGTDTDSVTALVSAWMKHGSGAETVAGVSSRLGLPYREFEELSSGAREFKYTKTCEACGEPFGCNSKQPKRCPDCQTIKHRELVNRSRGAA